MKVFVQAATAAPGGSLSALTRILAAWPEPDEILIGTWRASALEEFRESGHHVLRMPGGSTPEAILGARLRVRADLSRFAPDVIWGQQYYLPGFRTPQVIHQRNLLRFARDTSSLVDPVRDILSARGLRRASSLVFNSEALLNAALRRYPWLRNKECHIVYNGVDAIPWLPTTPEPDGVVRVLLPQSDAPHKRTEWAPAILERMRWLDPGLADRVQIRVAGVGSYGALLAEARKRRVGHQVSLLGYLDRRGLEDEYRHADVVLITSGAESFCNPVIEAHSAGIPIVAADLPVLRELDGPLLTLVSPADQAALAKALSETVRALPFPASLREQGKSFAALFASALQARRLRTVLQRSVA